jgi:hypothetical protein
MSDASSFSQLAARVETLERQTRRLKRLLLVSAVTVICAASVATSIAGQRNLTFAGTDGSVRISGSGLTLSDTAGRKRLTIGFNSANQPAIYIWDRDGVDRLGMYISSKGEPVVRLTDSRNVDRAFFGLTELEKPRISFQDHTSTERLYVGLTRQDDGLVSTYSTEGKQEINLGNQFISIADSAGTDRAYFGLTTNDTSIVKLWDKNHTERNFMGEYNDGTAGVSSFSSSGGATWSSP